MAFSSTRIATVTALAWIVAGLAPGLAAESAPADPYFVVVSVTEINDTTRDVKLKNPRTGYIHSVTVHIDIHITLNLQVGARVRERRENGGIILVSYDQPPESPSPPNPPKPQPTPKPRPAPKPPDPLRDYDIYRIGALDVVNSYSSPKDGRLSAEHVTSGHCDLLANGSFTSGGTTPVVPVMRNGRLDTKGVGKSLNEEDEKQYGGQATTDQRGGVAVSADGTIVVGRQQGREEADIRRAFGGNVWDFMGGGAMLIEGTSKTTADDLFHRQGFFDTHPNTKRVLPGRQGFGSAQLRSAAVRTLVGRKGEETFLIISPRRTGKQVQETLWQAGFSDVVLFDGGNGFFFTDGKTTSGAPTNNSLGLCIKIKR